jgi:hypothetical protein
MPNVPPAIARVAEVHKKAVLALGEDAAFFANHDYRPRIRALLDAAAPGSYRQNKLKLALILAGVASEAGQAYTIGELNNSIPHAITSANLDGIDELDAWAAENGSSLPPVAIKPANKLLMGGILDRVPASLARYDSAIRSKIRNTIASGFLDTVSTTDDMVDRVNADLKAERWRAERLVRTEVMEAYNASKHATLVEARDSGLAPDVKKTCVVTFDARTGKDSGALEGQVRALEEMFTDGAGRQYLHPPGRPNDREVEVPWLPDFEPPAEAPAELLATMPSDNAAETAEAVTAALSDVATKAGLDVPLSPAQTPPALAKRLSAYDEVVLAELALAKAKLALAKIEVAQALAKAEQSAAAAEAASLEAQEIQDELAALKAERLEYAQRIQDARGLQDAEPAPPPAAPPRRKAAVPQGWPEDPEKLEVVRQLGGSTGAELVRAADGALYVRKRGANPGHLEEEATADAAYQALGVPVPDFLLYRGANGDARTKLSRFIEGKSLRQVEQSDPALYEKVKAELVKNFHIDALLGNWDVAGARADNVLIASDGTPYRIDNGGALRYRAQGERKAPGAWSSGGCVDFWTMRDPATNSSAAKVFGGVNFDAALEAAAALWGEEDDGPGRLFGDFARPDGVSLSPEVRAALRQRLDDLEHAANQNFTMRVDTVREPYRQRLTLEVQRLRAAGISQKLPSELMPHVNSKGVVNPENVRDENGVKFDKLRGEGLIDEIKKHIDANGGDHNIVKKYTQSQGSNSWGMQPRALKYFWNTKVVDRGDPETEYFWKSSFESSKLIYENLIADIPGGAEKYEQSMAMFHAMTLELLHHVKMPGSMQNADGTYNLIRTEADFIPKTYFPTAKVGDVVPPYQRGSMESTSGYGPTYAYSSSQHKLVFLNVPAHRILGTYLLGWGEKFGDNDHTYLSDDENEFTADLHGISARWESDTRP